MSAEGILSLIKSTHLNSLDIGGNFVDPLVLNTLGMNTTLTDLNISNNLYRNGESYVFMDNTYSSGDDGSYTYGHNGDFSIYFPINHITTLSHLDLSNNPGLILSDTLIEALAMNPQLTSLYLDNTNAPDPWPQSFKTGWLRHDFNHTVDLLSKSESIVTLKLSGLPIDFYSKTALDIHQGNIIEWIKTHPEIKMGDQGDHSLAILQDIASNDDTIPTSKINVNVSDEANLSSDIENHNDMPYNNVTQECSHEMLLDSIEPQNMKRSSLAISSLDVLSEGDNLQVCFEPKSIEIAFDSIDSLLPDIHIPEMNYSFSENILNSLEVSDLSLIL